MTEPLPTVTVAIRELLLFLATVYENEPVPERVPVEIEIQLGMPLAAQVQPAAVVTETDPDAPVGPTVIVAGVTV